MAEASPNGNSTAEIGDDEDDNGVKTRGQVLQEQYYAQNSVFDDWFVNKAAHGSVSEAQVARVASAEPSESLKDLLRRHENAKRIVGSERAYQVELFERAKARNTIAVLDTGSGKTLVAILLLKYTLDKEIEDRAAQRPRRIAVFLVEKVTLMFQQASVLQANLSYPIAQVCGEMGTDLWSEEKWTAILSQHDCMVCTADILLFCLMRSFIKMEQINLLIFDEAHHAKKGDPYSRIMSGFYPAHPSPTTTLPRIFGMTASPVDVDGVDDIEQKASELEATLHSEIVTVSLSRVGDFVSRPSEEIVKYDRSTGVFESRLYQALKAKYWDLPYFNPLFALAKKVTFELGSWCGDLFWTYAFSEEAARKISQKREKIGSETQQGQAEIEQQIEDLMTAASDIREFSFPAPLMDHRDFSTKVLRLQDFLSLCFERPTDARCIVFVTEKITARLLHEVFSRTGGPHLRAGSLVGSRSRNIDRLKNTFTEQIKTLFKFKKGELNCLFATSVAEEGLDIPECNLVVRFDPCTTMIRYIQSRGRARHRNSKYVHFIPSEEDDMELDRLREIKECEQRMRAFCDAVPDERKLLGDAFEMLSLEDEDKAYPEFVVESTGARLSFFFSLTVLSHFAACVPCDEGDDTSLTYYIFTEGRKFRCEVCLPERARLPPIKGKLYRRKMVAKMSAAFEACKLLKKQGLLDEFLLPTIGKELHRMRNARLALKSQAKSNYEALLKPSIWSSERGHPPTRLSIAILSLSGEWDRSVSPLALLTRQRLPELPAFPLFRLDGIAVDAKIQNIGLELVLSDEVLEKLTRFTLTVFRDVFNKKFANEPSKFSYWIAPAKSMPTVSRETCAESVIDWDVVDMADENDRVQWDSEMKPEELIDRFIVDPYDGGRRLFTTGIAAELKPTDPIPAGVAPGPRPSKTIVEYSSSLWAKAKSMKTWNGNQPVLTATRVLHRLNVLGSPGKQEQEAKMKCYICLEPLLISRLPTQVAQMALLFPAIIHRIESYLIAMELAHRFDLDILPEKALEAITKDSDNSEDHDGIKVNVQHGMGPNYERLEFLGDCFLKMATSIAIYMRNPQKDEHWMHADRMILLCNQNLLNNAVRHGIVKYIRAQQFSRRTWYPEGLTLLEGKGAGTSSKEAPKLEQHLNGKTIADVCEAMIGAAFETHISTGYEPPACFDNAVRATTAFVISEKEQKHDMKCWADYYKAYNPPKWQFDVCSARELEIARQVQLAHDYTFKNPKLLISAFTHPSLPSIYASAPSYQRLEFLGDSLLDMVSVWHLFKSYPSADPGWLTEHKMAMVSNKFLGALGAQLGLHRFVEHQSALLQRQITEYVTEFDEAAAEAGDAMDFWQQLRDPPKLIADVVEAYIGAMFVDSAFTYAEVQRFFDQHMRPFFRDMTVYDTFANNHPVNRVRERLVVQLGCNNWRLMARERQADDERSSDALAALIVHQTVVGEGHATGSRAAKARAAQNASDKLEGIIPNEFRILYRCDCTGAAAEQPWEQNFGTAV